MGEVTTAWVLDAGDPRTPAAGELREETITLPDAADDETLVEPLYGSWEGNMTHALRRSPVDLCRLRGEEKVVLGNAGVVRVLRPGPAVKDLSEGQTCVLIPIGEEHGNGLLKKVFGYDAPRTVGLLAKRTKVRRRQVVPLGTTRHSLLQWAAFSIRYPTAWSNWKVALGCYRLRVPEEQTPCPFVWAWGGGVSIAELTLAKLDGCDTTMIASTDARLELLRRLGIRGVDRRGFAKLDFDPERIEEDPPYKRDYLAAEWELVKQVRAITGGAGVSIFIDNIGTPVYRATLRCLGTGGVITTCGWKSSADLTLNRATECMTHHTHVFTHGCKHAQGLAAFDFAERLGWVPPVEGPAWAWSEIPSMVREIEAGRVESYFPVYQVNAP